MSPLSMVASAGDDDGRAEKTMKGSVDVAGHHTVGTTARSIVAGLHGGGLPPEPMFCTLTLAFPDDCGQQLFCLALLGRRFLFLGARRARPIPQEDR